VLLLLLLVVLVLGFVFRPVGFLGGRSVIHPFFGEHHRYQASSIEMLALWEDHGAHLDRLLCWLRAFGQHARVHTVATGAIGRCLGPVDWWLG